MMLEELREMICEYVAVEKETITQEAKFIEDLGFTSYDFMSMLGEIEEKYGVLIDEKEASDIRTVADAVAYIEALQKR